MQQQKHTACISHDSFLNNQFFITQNLNMRKKLRMKIKYAGALTINFQLIVCMKFKYAFLYLKLFRIYISLEQYRHPTILNYSASFTKYHFRNSADCRIRALAEILAALLSDIRSTCHTPMRQQQRQPSSAAFAQQCATVVKVSAPALTAAVSMQ